MADRVLQRHDTAANWQTHNPVLAEGELGIITDGAKGYKIGDGVTAWNDLDYPANLTQIVDNVGTSTTVAISQRVVTEMVGLDEYLAFSEGTAYSVGDVVNYNGKLYQFISDHTAGAWVGNDVKETDVIKVHIVQELGNNEDRVVSQKALSEIINSLESKINEISDKIAN